MKAEDYVHRIGRTGRAGRSGLAVTLAERRDLLMIKRIQQFTTQQIPVRTVEGLEPKQPEPRIFAGSPQGQRGRPGARPQPGGFRGKPGRRDDAAPRDYHGASPRHDGFVARDEGRSGRESVAFGDRQRFNAGKPAPSRGAGKPFGNFAKPQRARHNGSR